MKKDTTSIILYIVLGISVLIAIWHYGFGNKEEVISTEGGLVSTAAPVIAGSDVLARFSKIKSLKFDTTVFGDPKFRQLQDNTVVLTDEAIGKADPFSKSTLSPAASAPKTPAKPSVSKVPVTR